jgi:hypothetical protein
MESTDPTNVKAEIKILTPNDVYNTNYNPNELLDIVLKGLLFNKPPIHTALEIQTFLSSKLIDGKSVALDEVEIIQILEHLVKDGYCKPEDREISYVMQTGTYKRTVRHYIITFEGKFFIADGGYCVKTRRLQEEQKEKLSLQTLEARLKEKGVRQNFWLIVIGSIAAIYYLIEILKVIKEANNYYHWWY